MGVYIGLELVRGTISQQKWQETYMETLQLLNAYPFVDLKRKQVGYKELLIYARDLENDTDNPDKRHWCVCGDMKSKKTGESFCLSYNLHGNQFKSFSDEHDAEGSLVEDAGKDILKEIALDGNASCIFNDKTQGRPYHIYVLGIAMLLETRLEPYVAVTGNITLGQAKKAKKWADAVLKEPVNIPVRINKGLLYQRLSSHFQNIDLIDAFFKLWPDLRERPDGFLMEQNFNAYQEWFVNDMKTYSSPSQPGAIDLFINWLNHTKDLPELCRMACQDQNGPLYNPQQFAEAICDTWLTIPMEKYDFLDVFLLPTEVPESVHSLFGNVFLSMHFKGRNMTYYQPKEEVIEVLEQALPGQIDGLNQVFDEGMNDIEAALAMFEKGIASITSGINNERNDEGDFLDEEEFLLYYNDGMKIPENRQKSIELLAYRGKMVLDKYKFYEKDLGSISYDKVKILISLVSKLRMVLTEEAWDWINAEDNDDILKMLIMFGIFELDNDDSCPVVRALFENRALCVKLMQLMGDQRVMDRAQAEVAKVLKDKCDQAES